jgi:hypothetical protein
MDTGVGKGDIQPSHLFPHSGAYLFPALGILYAVFDEHGPRVAAYAPRGFFVTAGEDYPGALGDQAVDSGFADAIGAAGDQRDLVFQLTCHRFLILF